MNVFELWVKNFQNFGKNISADLSTMHSSCPGEYFEENNSFWKNLKFVIVSGPWAEIFRIFSDKISIGLPKLRSTSPEEHFGFGFQKNMKMFTPNRQNLEKKNQPSERMILLS